MRGFSILWLLLYTKTGRVILGILITYVIASILGWWTVPVVSGLIGAFLLYMYYDMNPQKPKQKKKKTSESPLYNPDKPTAVSGTLEEKKSSISENFMSLIEE